MLRLRLTIDAQPRSKNGHPAHRTTGVARANWIQIEMCIGTRWCSAGIRWPPISSRNTGKASARPIQKRRVISASSGLGPASAAAISGSSAMPQIGQLPGASRRISGCIGQVQIVPSVTAAVNAATG